MEFGHSVGLAPLSNTLVETTEVGVREVEKGFSGEKNLKTSLMLP